MAEGLLRKFAVEDEFFNFDFSKRQQIVGGDTIASAVITQTHPTGVALTIGSPTYSVAFDKVQIRVSGGTDDVTYDIECKATLTGGEVIASCGKLYIKPC